MQHAVCFGCVSNLNSETKKRSKHPNNTYRQQALAKTESKLVASNPTFAHHTHTHTHTHKKKYVRGILTASFASPSEFATAPRESFHSVQKIIYFIQLRKHQRKSRESLIVKTEPIKTLANQKKKQNNCNNINFHQTPNNIESNHPTHPTDSFFGKSLPTNVRCSNSFED